MGRLAVEGTREIYYEHYRGRGAVPVVLVHGWGMSCRVWDYVIPDLQDAGHDVVVFDDRACGLSDRDFEDVSVDALGSDVVALVDHLGFDRVVLNGWSHGGGVVTDAGVKLGDRLAGLVLTGGATPRFVQADDWPYGNTTEGLEELLAALRDDRISFFDGLSQGVCHVAVGKPVIDWMWKVFTETGPQADESLRDLGRIDQRGILDQLQAPTLILAGRHDTFVSIDHAREQTKLFPKAEIVEFETGHAPFIEARDEYRSALTEFLGRLG
jgi:non-heme chloroperoxidase